MIIKEQITYDLPMEYIIDIYLDNLLSEQSITENPNRIILTKNRLKVPDVVTNDRNIRTANRSREMQTRRFAQALYNDTEDEWLNLVRDNQTILRSYIDYIDGYESTSIYTDENNYICYAYYVVVHIKEDKLKDFVPDNMYNKLKKFKIRFAEHINSQEYLSIANPETLVLNTIYAIDTKKEILDKFVRNIIDSRYRLYNYISNSDNEINSFTDIDNKIYNDCLKYKKQAFR